VKDDDVKFLKMSHSQNVPNLLWY